MKSLLQYLVLILYFAFLDAVKFRCDYRYTSAGWFKYHEIPATWRDARLQCKLEGGMLASPTTDTIKSLMLESFCKPEIFTGIHSIFSKGQFTSIDGIPLDEIPHEWAPLEPDNKNDSESCISLNTDGKLSDVKCDELLPYICYRETSNIDITVCGTPDPEYHFYSKTKKCYKFHTNPRTFDRAYFACSAEGGHLAIINSEEEAIFLRQMFDKYPIAKLLGRFNKHYAYVGFHNWGENGSIDWTTIHGAVKFRCDYRYTSVGWFKYHEIPATWRDARLQCKLEGGMLASPTTATIQSIMLESFCNTDIFTGIHATFAKGQYTSIDGVPLEEFTHEWAPLEPDNKNIAESCLTLNTDGKLADVRCDEPRPYICYRENSDVDVTICGTPDQEYHFNSQTNKCYKFHTNPRTFDRAYFACSAEGGHLAIINNEAEAIFLRQMFNKYPASQLLGRFNKDFAFIGFHTWGESMDWTTIHGQSLQDAGFATFAAGQPDNASPGEHCGSLYRNGLLNDMGCAKLATFICEKRVDYPAVCDTNEASRRNITECEPAIDIRMAGSVF